MKATCKMSPLHPSAELETPTLEAPVCERSGSHYTDALVQRLQTVFQDRDSIVIGVAGCSRRRSGSCISIDLAIRASDHLLVPTLLVDANSKNRTVSKHFKCETTGFEACLSGRQDVESSSRETELHGLSILGRRRGCSRRHRTSSVDAGRFVDHVRRQYRLTILDLPVLTDPASEDVFLSRIDGLFLVAPYGVRRSRLAALRSHFGNEGVRLLGAVMVGDPSPLPNWLQRLV